jgi:hypothetical protein
MTGIEAMFAGVLAHEEHDTGAGAVANLRQHWGGQPMNGTTYVSSAVRSELDDAEAGASPRR